MNEIKNKIEVKLRRLHSVNLRNRKQKWFENFILVIRQIQKNVVKEEVLQLYTKFQDFLEHETEKLSAAEFFKYIDSIDEHLFVRKEVMQLLCIIARLYSVSEKELNDYIQQEKTEPMNLK